MFVEELSHALRESGTLKVDEGVGRLTGDLSEFADRDRFNSLDDVIANRIDRLPPSQQLTLKVASVIGYEFPYRVLRHIFPLTKERTNLLDSLTELDQGQLMHPLTSRSEIEYSFRHRTIHDVAYENVLKKHRVELHRGIAEWIEENKADEIDAHYSLLAEHWLQAGELRKSIQCLTHAGRNALRINANHEAARFFRKAISLESNFDEHFEVHERGCWHRRYAEALYRQGMMALSLQHFRIALKLLGYPDPESLIGQIAHGAFEFVKQDWQRFRARLFGKKSPQPKEATFEATRAYGRLFEIHYMQNDSPALFLATFRALNLAERQGVSTAKARAKCNASIILSAIRLHKAAVRQSDQAIQIATESGDTPSLAYVRTLNALHYLNTAAWEKANESVSIGLQLSKEIGDRRCHSEALAISMSPFAWQGNWDAITDACDKLVEQSKLDNVPQAALWSLGWLLWRESACHPHAESTQQTTQTLIELVEDDGQMADADRIFARGALMLAHMRKGEWDGAIRLANEIEEIMGKSPQVAFYLSQTYAALSDFYFALNHANYDSPAISPLELEKRMRKLQTRIRLFTIVVPMMAPLRHLHAGRRCVLKGRNRKARYYFEKGARAARRLRIPYLVAMLGSELSAIAKTAEERNTWNAESSTIFEQLKIENPSLLLHKPTPAAVEPS